MRLGLLLAAAALGPAAANAEAVTPLVRTTAEEDVAAALAGDEALYTRPAGRRLELRAVPVGGGTPITRLRFEAPRDAEATSPRLGASAQAAALTVTTATENGLAAFQAFTGPPAGPLTPLGPLTEPDPSTFLPASHQVDGARIFTTEIRGDVRVARLIVREAGAEPAEVALPELGLYSAVFAGELVAYAVPAPGQPADDEPQRLVVADWRTGQRRATVRVRRGVGTLALAPDGRVVVGEDGGGLLEVAPGAGGVRRLSRSGGEPVLAGGTVVAVRSAQREGDEGLIAIGPDRRVRRFGVPSARIEGLVADERRVLWRANGCVLTATPGEPAAAAPGSGPCPRSELFFDDELDGRADRRGRVPALLRCVAAAPPGCRGSVRLDADRGAASTTVPVRIPAGERRLLTLRLNRRGRRQIRGDGLVELRAVVVDPGGRRSVLRDGYGVSLPR